MSHHSFVRIVEKNPEWNPELPFELKLAFDLSNLDISLANGLRRVALADIPTVSVGPDIELDLDKNITVFNSQYLKDRFSMQPIHIDSLADLDRFRNSRIIFRVADPDNWDQPLVNNENQNKHITAADLIVLEKLGEEEEELRGLAPLPIEEEEEMGVEEIVGEGASAAELEKASNALEANETFVAQAEAQEELMAGSVAGSGGENDEQEPVAARYRRLDPKDFFTYLDMYLLTLKKGESLYTEMKPVIGYGKDHARWSAAPSIYYRFKPAKGNLIDDPNYWESSEYNPIDDRKDYPRAAGAAGQYGTPQVYEIAIEYNGHYRPAVVWLAAIQTLRSKISRFQEGIRQITGVSGQVTDWLAVAFSPREEIPNMVTLTIFGEDHTLGNIVFSHFLYALQDLVKQIAGNNFDEEILKGFSHYRVPHPLDNKMIIMLRVPDWSMDQLNTGFNGILKPGENQYDDIFYQNTPTLRLLMIVLDRVINTLKDVEQDAQNVLESVINGTAPYEPMYKRLPQATIKPTITELDGVEITVKDEEEELDEAETVTEGTGTVIEPVSEGTETGEVIENS